MSRLYLFKNSNFRFAVFIMFLFLCWFLGREFNIKLEGYRSLLSRYPLYLSGIIFVVMYVVVTFFVWFGPKDVFRIAGALLFGPYISSLLVWISEMFNAAILFQVSRRLGRDFVQRRLGVKSNDINRLGRADFLGVFALRFNPFIPFRGLDLCAGLSGISFKVYWLACLVASPIRIFWLQYILTFVGNSIFDDPQYMVFYLKRHSIFLYYSLVYFVSVVVVSIIAMVIRGRGKRQQMYKIKSYYV